MADEVQDFDDMRPDPVTKDEFLAANPFGTIYTDKDGDLRLLTQEEYDEWVEGSRGIWDDAALTES
jgi:hypothetical protein